MNKKIILGVIVVILLLIGGAIGYNVFERITALQTELADTQNTLETTEHTLGVAKDENEFLNEQLKSTQENLTSVQNELRKTQGGLELLSKLTTIDPELLKKYSKVFFLNEHYEPDSITQISKKYWNNQEEPELIHADVWPFLRALLTDAQRDDINLRIVSAYRTFDDQRTLKNTYNVIYGEGTANQFSAVQGYSEHQLGTTVDFTTEELGDNFESIDTTEAYEWLLDNAYKHGFVLSYPEGNAYYQFEPWHWRFVGKDLALELHKRKINFYDMSQQEIDTYRLNLFEE